MFHKGYWQYLNISSIVEDLFSILLNYQFLESRVVYTEEETYVEVTELRMDDMWVFVLHNMWVFDDMWVSFCWRYVSFFSSQYVSFWRYVGFYFVDDMWVFSGIILFMIFEYGSIIKLDLICWSPQIMWIMWILSQKQVCVRGDKILLKSSFVPFHQYYPIQSTTHICSFPPMTQEPFGEYILLKAYNFDNDWLVDFAGKSPNRIEFSQEIISSFPPTTKIHIVKGMYNDWVHF